MIVVYLLHGIISEMCCPLVSSCPQQRMNRLQGLHTQSNKEEVVLVLSNTTGDEKRRKRNSAERAENTIQMLVPDSLVLSQIPVQHPSEEANSASLAKELCAPRQTAP